MGRAAGFPKTVGVLLFHLPLLLLAFDVNLLKTRAQCLAARVALEAELDTYSIRNQNPNFQDRQAVRSETSVAARLATATYKTRGAGYWLSGAPSCYFRTIRAGASARPSARRSSPGTSASENGVARNADADRSA